MTVRKWFISFIVLLLIGAIGFAAFKFVEKKLAEPRGMYVEFNGEVYEADDTGIAVRFRHVAAFTVKHADGWGLYDVSECKVKIYVNTAESCNFSYTVDGDDTPLYFSLLNDVTSAFVEEASTYDGRGLPINADGEFNLHLGQFFSMEKLLGRLHGVDEVVLDGEVNTANYPYFILQVTSPDGTETIKLPFTLYELPGEILGVKLDETQLVF